MDATNFTLEFTQLLTRYTKSRTPNENAEFTGTSKAPLTSDAIIQLVQESLRIILPEPYIPNISVSVNKTPVNDIILNTPDAPFIQRTGLNENGIISECTDGLSDKLSSNKINKKASSSQYNLRTTRRSNTFVQDDNNSSIKKDTDNSPINTETIINIADDDISEVKILPNNVHLNLDALRKSASDVITNIDEFKRINEIQSSNINAIRRVSSIGSSVPRPSMLRPDQAPKKRRSFVFPGTTPTSSRLNNTVILNENLSKRKSTSSMSLNVTATNATSTKSLIPTLPNVRSHSNLSNSTVKKAAYSESRPKNPRYAHVQSRISRSSLARR